jgi:hypothetical protein
MKQYAEHGRVGICHALRLDEMYTRVFSGGYPYLKNGLIIQSNSLTPIYSYGKNYEKSKKKFALFVWTTEKDVKVIEAMFADTLKKVTNKQIDEASDNGSFAYID